MIYNIGINKLLTNKGYIPSTIVVLFIFLHESLAMVVEDFYS